MRFTNVLLIRPGALGDSILTLPVIHALRTAGAQRVTVLGTPANWKFLSPEQTFVEVLDFGSADWLWLFGDTLPPSAAATSALRNVDLVIDYANVPAIDRLVPRVLRGAAPD